MIFPVQLISKFKTSGTSTSATEKEAEKEREEPSLPRLSELLQLDALWDILGDCLTGLMRTSDPHAVLVLQPAVEAFFLVHAGNSTDTGSFVRANLMLF